MNRYAILVDAGYLYSASAAALTGDTHHPRSKVRVDYDHVAPFFQDYVASVLPGRELLRVLWFDGADNPGDSQQHLALGYRDNITVRLGAISKHGNQKGVDTLIVTDLVELAQNRAVADIFLVSGDDDLRVGVMIAKKYGVRIHLVGIEAPDKNVSNSLRQEVDTTRMLSTDHLAKLVSVKSSSAEILVGQIEDLSSSDTTNSLSPAAESGLTPTLADSAEIEGAVGLFCHHLTQDERSEIANLSSGLPSLIDSALLKGVARRIGRKLEADEKRKARSLVRAIITKPNS